MAPIMSEMKNDTADNGVRARAIYSTNGRHFLRYDQCSTWSPAARDTVAAWSSGEPRYRRTGLSYATQQSCGEGVGIRRVERRFT